MKCSLYSTKSQQELLKLQQAVFHSLPIVLIHTHIKPVLNQHIKLWVIYLQESHFLGYYSL